jgi:hypothetical protein
MNDLDENLAQLFARDESLADDDAFVAAVRGRIASERRKAKAFQLALVVAIAAVAGAAVIAAPEALLYPVQLANRLLGSQSGAVACLLGAIGVVWWTRFGDA